MMIIIIITKEKKERKIPRELRKLGNISAKVIRTVTKVDGEFPQRL